MKQLALGISPPPQPTLENFVPGANAELLGPDLAGQVVSEGDLRALIQVLGTTVREHSRRAYLAARARQRVIERYTLDGMVAAYERLYRGEF